MELKITPQILKGLEDTAKCKVILEPFYQLAGQIVFQDGRKFYFKNTSIDINNHGAAEVAKDKGYTRTFMENMGYKIPHGTTFFSDHWCKINNATNNSREAILYADSLGYPLILKPNSRGQGKDVYKVYDTAQLEFLLPLVIEKNNVILIEEFVMGNDYRVVVLGEEVMMAYRRVPLAVRGDGSDTINQLLNNKKVELAKAGRKIIIDASDSRITERLVRAYGTDISYVPPSGEEIILLDNANLSSGGEAEDVTDIMHESYKALAVKLTRDLGLTFAGVDFITKDDITKPAIAPTFIEINCSPGLIHYRSLSATTHQKVDDLYLKILLKLSDKK